MTDRVFSLAALALLAAPAIAAGTGEALFADRCSGCHQPGGVGQSGLAPPLANKPLWSRLGPRGIDYLAGVLVGGFSGTITANGERFIGLAMPPQNWMSDEDMKAIADYVLNDLNGVGVDVSMRAFITTRQAPPPHPALRALREEAMR